MKFSPLLCWLIGLALVIGGCSSSKTEKAEKPQKAKAERPQQTEGKTVEAPEAKPDAAQEPMDPEEAQDTLVGIWRVKLDALAEDSEIKKMPESEREGALKQAQQMLANLGFEFTPDGQMNLYIGDKIRKGTYKVMESRGDKLVLETRHGEPKPEVETVEVIIGDETLTVSTPGKKQVLVLERGPPGAGNSAPDGAAPGEAPTPAAGGQVKPAVAPANPGPAGAPKKAKPGAP